MNQQSVTIWKIGGNVFRNPQQLTSTLDSFAAIKQHKILVHGGGPQATALSKRLGIVPQMKEGRRITDDQTLEVVTMVYGGLINKQLVAALQSKGVNALGLSGADGDVIRAQKRPVQNIDYGWAGDIVPQNQNSSLVRLLQSGFTPVFCALTHDGQGQLLNTNADTIASHLAQKLCTNHQVSLSYCFDKPGVLRDPEDPDSVIAELNAHQYQKLKATGNIAQGMIPKLDNAFQALNAGVHHVRLGNPNSLSSHAQLATKLCTNSE